MRGLAALAASEARALGGLVFDLDGTVLTDGRLTLPAYRAIHRLREAGLRLVVCTGRPAGWGAVLARQWPIDLAVTENGAMAHYVVGGVLATIDPLDPAARAARRAALAALVSLLAAEFGDVPLADDNHARVSDVTFDVGERARVAADRIAALRAAAQALGARCFESSIHLHVTLDAADKASGTLAALARVLGEDVGAARTRYAFVGDSANDAACFAAFHLGFGVANVRAELARLTLPPRFVSASAAGEGFCEVVDRLLALRA